MVGIYACYSYKPTRRDGGQHDLCEADRAVRVVFPHRGNLVADFGKQFPRVYFAPPSLLVCVVAP